MHELAIAQSLLATICDVALRHGAAEVKRAVVEIGELSCCDPVTLGFAFEVSRRATVAEHCELRVEMAPLVVTCPACGYDGRGTIDHLGCPGCGGVPVGVVSGRQIRLVSIDVDDGDGAKRRGMEDDDV